MEQFWRRLGFVARQASGSSCSSCSPWSPACLAFGATNLEFATGQDSYLNSDSQTAIDNQRYQEDFGGETLILLFEATDDADISGILNRGDNLQEFERLEQELRDIPEVYSVLTPLTSLEFSENITVSGTGTTALSSALEREPDPDAAARRQEDLNTTLARLPADDERQLGTETWDQFLLFGNENVEVTDGQATLPTGDDRVVRASLQATFPNLETAVGGVVLEGNADLDTLSAGTEKVLEVMDTVDLDGFEITVTGSPVFLKDINDYLQGGMLTLGAIALAVMAVILFLLFRVRWRFLPLLSTVVGVAWGFALLGYIDVDLSLVTISGLPILIGLGIDFAIQIHNRIEEEAALDHDEHPISETVANVAPAVIAATIAAVVAFLALQISQVPMIRDFGVMLAIGIVALVFCGIVLPVTILGVREYRSRTRGPGRLPGGTFRGQAGQPPARSRGAARGRVDRRCSWAASPSRASSRSSPTRSAGSTRTARRSRTTRPSRRPPACPHRSVCSSPRTTSSTTTSRRCSTSSPSMPKPARGRDQLVAGLDVVEDHPAAGHHVAAADLGRPGLGGRGDAAGRPEAAPDRGPYGRPGEPASRAVEPGRAGRAGRGPRGESRPTDRRARRPRGLDPPPGPRGGRAADAGRPRRTGGRRHGAAREPVGQPGRAHLLSVSPWPRCICSSGSGRWGGPRSPWCRSGSPSAHRPSSSVSSASRSAR
ncbi:MAG: MMPL family transporter [Acidimicrobiales bacterium]|nr:MMPL family transporter [Acidimicrobiales bacterium]